MLFDETGIHLHQSDLKNHCLEKLRLETVATGPRMENDAATLGTAIHRMIEHELLVEAHDNLHDIRAHAAHMYVNLLEEYAAAGKPFALSSFGDHRRAVDYAAELATAWYKSSERERLLTAAEKPLVEWEFDLPFCEVEVKKNGKKAEIIPVFLAGMADIVWSAENVVWDWKTSGSEYRRWEYQRWGRQPDVYLWAASQAGLIVPNSEGLFTFEFKVFVRGQNPEFGAQSVTVNRSDKNFAWLQNSVGRLVNMAYNMGLEREWPTDDQHVLCSPKWCTFFDMCKGAHVNGETWV
jgi:hypothetical protein